MFILCGKTCSGKNALARELISRGYSMVTTYTTRPPREKEVDGVDYHFLTKDEFLVKEKEGFFAETMVYHTAFGDWYYGSAKEDYKSGDTKKFIILTPNGVNSISEIRRASERLIPVFYIYANNTTIQRRLKGRGDDASEAMRRVHADQIDFKGFEEVASKIIYNNSGTSIKEVADRLEAHLASLEE